jgi:SAM-dependent methyltransferase
VIVEEHMALFRDAVSVYLSALRIGLVTLLRGRWVEGAKQLIAPVGYWRMWPNAVILSEYRSKAPKRILDVSSPKLPSLILGRHAEVWATDLDDPQLMSRWKTMADALGLRSYHARYENACWLSFPDASFDLVYSISVIEHIPEGGDNQALAEFARVVRPGGTVIVEVPYRRQRQEISHHYDSKGAPLAEPRFYERYYDREWLDRRLQTPGLRREQCWILGEWLPVDPWIATPRLPRPLRLLLLPFEPLLALVNYWMRSDDEAGRPLAALIVFSRTI